MRLESVFLSVRPMVLSLARSTICSSTTLSSSRRRVHLACPSGAGPQASAISFASAAPSKIRGRAEFGLYLRVNTASNPSSTNCRRVRSILAMLVSRASAIRLSLQPSPASEVSAFKRMRAFVSNCADRLPERIKTVSFSRSSALSRTTYFLAAISFPATNHLHHCFAATVIQNLPSKSTTDGTSGKRRVDGPAHDDPVGAVAELVGMIIGVVDHPALGAGRVGARRIGRRGKQKQGRQHQGRHDQA